MVSVVAALMAVMMVASAAPAMANDIFGGFNDRGDLLDNDIGVFDGFRHHDRFGDDDEDLDTIRVGDWECLVEDEDDVKFCVNKDTGEISRVF